MISYVTERMGHIRYSLYLLNYMNTHVQIWGNWQNENVLYALGC